MDVRVNDAGMVEDYTQADKREYDVARFPNVFRFTDANFVKASQAVWGAAEFRDANNENPEWVALIGLKTRDLQMGLYVPMNGEHLDKAIDNLTRIRDEVRQRNAAAAGEQRAGRPVN